MNGRTTARVLLVAFLVLGAIGIGVTAYNAGVSAGIAHDGAVVVQPGAYQVAPYAGWGWGFGWGFPFAWFFGGLFFLFLLFGLVRLAFGGPRGRVGHGWSGGGWRDDRGRTWEERARDIHAEWHRTQPDGAGTAASGPGGTDRPGA